MFDVSSQELLLLGAVAIAVIPPKDLPRAMRFAGQWIGKARGMARHFRSGLDEIVRQAELEEIEKKWREENERIMREHPLQDAIEHPSEPAALPAPVTDMVVEAPPPEALAEAVPVPEPQAEPVVDQGIETASVEPEPEPVMKATRAPRPVRTTPVEEDIELPLGLPPKQ